MRPRAPLLLALLLLAAWGHGATQAAAPAPPATPPPTTAAPSPPVPPPGEADEDALPAEEAARRVRAARLALEKFHQAVLKEDLETAWDMLSSDEKRLSFSSDVEVFRAEVDALHGDDGQWVFYRTMTIGDVSLDEDDPQYAYATIRFEDEDGEADEDQVDLVLRRGTWYVDGGYF